MTHGHGVDERRRAAIGTRGRRPAARARAIPLHESAATRAETAAIRGALIVIGLLALWLLFARSAAAIDEPPTDDLGARSMPAAVETGALELDSSKALAPVSARPPRSLDEMWGHETATPETFDYDGLPGRLADASLRTLWREGLTHERAERLVDSALAYERIVARVAEESYTYWRIARNYWRKGESLPLEDEGDRLAYFERAEHWSARGIAVDPGS